MGELSAFVERRWGSWGILILGLWALVLALVALARLVLLSAVVGSGNENVSQGQVWVIFILNALLALAFAACVYGLWTRRHWGRILFMVCIAVWAVFYVVALLTSGTPWANNDYTPGSLAFNLVPYLGGVILSVWYLNLPHIKALFDHEASANQ
ncbi:MAG: hypothetical protein DPW09_39135 [Anaerolineae bacterium]|nr:hypothetical protein [Anaerolineae bacterium]